MESDGFDRRTLPIQRKLTPWSTAPARVMTYSMETPMSGSFSAVNKTPPELIFLVSPRCITLSVPLRVMERGNCRVNRRVRRCSTIANLVSFVTRVNHLFKKNDWYRYHAIEDFSPNAGLSVHSGRHCVLPLQARPRNFFKLSL